MTDLQGNRSKKYLSVARDKHQPMQRPLLKPLHFFLLVYLFVACQPAVERSAVDVNAQYIPSEDLGILFHDVQMAQVFPDSKTFVDSDPLRPASEIAAEYLEIKSQPDFSLEAFVKANFKKPEPKGAGYVLDTTKSFSEVLTEKWDYLTRSPDERSYGSLIPLPYKYVVPGGRFGEIYYWDSYFTMLGLQVSGREDLMENMLDNFAYLIDSIGFIPNGNRTYFLSRSQPPFFAGMVNLLADSKGDTAVLKYLPALEKEHAFWMDGSDKLNDDNKSYRRVVMLGDGQVLNRYFDDQPEPRPESYREDVELAEGLNESQKKALYINLRAACESGWDFSTRWFAIAGDFQTIVTTEILPVDLNALMYNLEATISRLKTVNGEMEGANQFDQLASTRAELIQTYFWSVEKGYFMDYHWPSAEQRDFITPAGMYPLYFGLANEEQAQQVAIAVRRNLLKPGGINTTNIVSGQQWDAPNGWAPLQWMTIYGFRRYGDDKLADQISERWLELNSRVFNKTGKMMEKYNVLDLSLDAGGGEYPTQDGFGWSNGVVLRLMHDERINNKR